MSRILHIANWYPSTDEPKRALWIRDQIQLLAGQTSFDVWHLEVQTGPLELRTMKLGSSENSLILQFPTRRWWLIEIMSSLLLLYFLCFKIRLKHYSHIHFHIAYPLLTFWHLFKKFVQRPLIVSEHWSAYHFHFHVKDKSKLKRIKRIFFNNMELVAVSHALADDIQSFSGNDHISTTILPNVVDTNCFKYKKEDIQPYTYFMVSQWKDPKDPFVIIQSIAANPKLKLRIGGYGPQWENMQMLTKELGIGDRVKFLGPLSKEEIAMEMRQSAAFIHASDYETFSVVCAEAICCGCPVIASNVGGIKEFIDESNGALIMDPSEWTAALDKDLTKFDRKTVSQAARNRFDIATLRHKMQGIYG